MKNKRRSREFGAFAVLILTAMIFGNVILALISVIPLLFAVLSLSYPVPGKVTVRRESYEIKSFKGDETEIRTEISVEEGAGIVVIGDTVSDRLYLASGNNFRVFWKGKEPLRTETVYSVKCNRIGFSTVGPINGEFIHFSNFGTVRSGEIDKEAEITVRPRQVSRRLLRDRRLRVPMPLPSVSKMGTRTTDFLEIRQYLPGDPYRDINWKATIRSGRDESNLLVNIYEREGNKSVWIFLDGRPHMNIGSTADDAFEHGIQAAHTLSHLYLARECRVGFYILGSGHLITPDVGGRQDHAIDSELKTARIYDNRESLLKAMTRCRGHTAGQSPLIVVITVAGPHNIDELRSCTENMKTIFGKKSQAMIVHIDAHRVSAETDSDFMAASLLDLEETKMLRSLRKRATVCYWDPMRQDLLTALVERDRL